MVHHYERYAWTVITLVMLFLWGLGAKAGFDINAQKAIEAKGKSLSSDILGFGSIVFGSFTGVSILDPAFGSGTKMLSQVVIRRSGLQLPTSCEHATNEGIHPDLFWPFRSHLFRRNFGWYVRSGDYVRNTNSIFCSPLSTDII